MYASVYAIFKHDIWNGPRTVLFLVGPPDIFGILLQFSQGSWTLLAFTPLLWFTPIFKIPMMHDSLLFLFVLSWIIVCHQWRTYGAHTRGALRALYVGTRAVTPAQNSLESNARKPEVKLRCWHFGINKFRYSVSKRFTIIAVYGSRGSLITVGLNYSSFVYVHNSTSSFSPCSCQYMLLCSPVW